MDKIGGRSVLSFTTLTRETERGAQSEVRLSSGNLDSLRFIDDHNSHTILNGKDSIK